MSNMLLAKLPRKVLSELLPQLEVVTLGLAQELSEAGDTARHIHFPLLSLVSVRVVVGDKRSVEVALVGREGMVGLAPAPGGAFPFGMTVQTAGSALRIGRGRLLSARRRHPGLDALLHDYALVLMAQISTSAGCNHFHLLEARLARRLLMTRDRLGSDTFRITQEFLSSLMAVRRVGISEAASSLQRQHLIEYHRGDITILDPKGLKAACCTCSRD